MTDRPPPSTLPPVEAVRPGLWSLPVPIPNNPLGYTLVYAFETDGGPVLVDSGWDDPTTWAALTEGLASGPGCDVADCRGVLVTHMHPDHHGLSGRVREASGAWIAMHPADEAALVRRHEIDDEWLLQIAAVCLDAGAPEEELEGLPTADQMGKLPPLVRADRPLEDGALADVPGWHVRTIWTPGHSPGHTCFFVDGPDVLLSGDHVLPDITPHIGLYVGLDDPEPDPLGDFLAALDRVAAEPATEVLPAHQHRFPSIKRRVHELHDHHQTRLNAIEASLLAAGVETTWDIAAAMPWNRAWEDLGALMKRTALSEAFAHIRHLERQGRVERVPDAWPISYQLTAARAAALRAAS
ncbi:MAG: MBL fold metallo-hydrolase [Acidimicrobiales bacterium]